MTLLERYFQPNIAFAVVIALALSQYVILMAFIFGASPDFVLGGDFIAFWSAAREVLDGNLTGLYTPDGLEAAIAAHRPGVDVSGLTWQYPPHASLIFSPIGYLPYEIAYALWCALGLAFFTGVLVQTGVRGRWLIAALATIPILIVLNTGQNALFTGGLLLLAVTYAKPKPVLAGVAAALLTVKPQLGFLLPVVFIVNGHWRAFGVAALASLALWAASFIILGGGAWAAFFGFVGTVGEAVSDGVMPLFKMVNVYAAARLAWLPDLVAAALAISAILMAIAALVWTCRRTDEPAWHYAVLATGTLLAAPYSMYYELVLLVPAIIFLLQQGARTGWLSWEREMIACMALLTLIVPGPAVQFGVSISFITCALVAWSVFRRVRHAFSAKNDETAAQIGMPQPAAH